MAAALRQEPDVEVEVIDGKHGEFAVLLDGATIAEKNGSLPDVQDIVKAVRAAEIAPVPIGAPM